MKAYAVYIALCSILIQDMNARYHRFDLLRTNILEEEFATSVGANITLNEDEIIANNILMKFKWKELESSFNNPEYFNFSKHYFTYKKDIEKSKVYQIIKRMPKGALLHIHSSLMLDADGLFEFTYEDHLYACYSDDLKLQFAETAPEKPCPVDWVLLSDLRNASSNVELFDAKLKTYFSLEEHDFCDTNINEVWNNFNTVHKVMKALLAYRPVREKIFYKTLQKFYNDNIMYAEIRSGLHDVFELNGTKSNLADLYEQVTKKFIENYPDFIGIKLVITKNRARSIDQIREGIEKARDLKRTKPELFAGFDLLGQEDLGKPLKDFLPALIEAKDDMNFYFHCGETNWYGTTTDENLIDAVLLGTKRIGHGYSLSKHPAILKAVRDNDIAVEVNVISNVVLSLVHDVRNHPLATYLALGLPIVLSSDDPGMWGSDPLSHDFYVAFVGIASKHADLRMLKQLALNSIKYSALDDSGKSSAFMIFDKKWNDFIKDVISNDSFK